MLYIGQVPPASVFVHGNYYLWPAPDRNTGVQTFYVKYFDFKLFLNPFEIAGTQDQSHAPFVVVA